MTFGDEGGVQNGPKIGDVINERPLWRVVGQVERVVARVGRVVGRV